MNDIKGDNLTVAFLSFRISVQTGTVIIEIYIKINVGCCIFRFQILKIHWTKMNKITYVNSRLQPVSYVKMAMGTIGNARAKKSVYIRKNSLLKVSGFPFLTLMQNEQDTGTSCENLSVFRMVMF